MLTRAPGKAPTHFECEEVVRVLVSEEEHGASVDVAQELGDADAQPLEGVVAPRRAQDEEGEEELETDAPHHGPPIHLNSNCIMMIIITMTLITMMIKIMIIIIYIIIIIIKAFI